MTFRLLLKIKFNKMINTRNYNISPDGFRFIFKDGIKTFDFLDSSSVVDFEDKYSIIFELKNPDTSYEDTASITEEDIHNLLDIQYIYVDLEGCIIPGIKPVEVETLCFSILTNDKEVFEFVDYSNKEFVSNYDFDYE